MAGQLKRQGKDGRGGGKGGNGSGTASGTSAPATKQDNKFWVITGAEQDGDALDIKVTDISPCPFNDREMGDLTHLAESIGTDGLMSDINVMHTSAFAEQYPDAAAGITTKYTIAFGERRWRAAQMAGLTVIPAILRNDIVPKIRRILFAENFHRKQLLPVEEAREFNRLKLEDGLSIRGIVAELKLSGPSYVANRLKLLELPDTLQRIVGAEGGPGATTAKHIASKVHDPDDMIAVWNAIREEGISVTEAVRRYHAGDISAAETPVPEQRHADDVETPPTNDDTSENEKPAREPTAESPVTKPNPSEADSEPSRDEKEGEKPQKPVASTGTGKKTAVDQEASQRAHASADREETCKGMVAQAFALSTEQIDALFARALLAPTQQTAARTRAQKWLRDAGKAGFTISDTDSYFEAVLSSGNTDLIKTVTVTTALAACEVRARDGRRQWDVHDAEHVRLLIEAGNHHPESAWERAQLKKYNVAFPIGDDADADSTD